MTATMTRLRQPASSPNRDWTMNHVGRILVVDDHAQARESMAEVLRHAGHHVETCSGGSEALRRCEQLGFDVILTDLQMPGMTGLQFVQALALRGSDTQIVMVTAHPTIASAVEAMKHGVFDYLEKPFDADRLERVVERALQQAAAVAAPPAGPEANPSATPVLIGSSPAMQMLRERILRVAATDETVLIAGESGTGKELVARSVHAAGRRARQVLVSLNCPALSAQLMESELFGHERGAFTGADAQRIGRFELAQGGTLLLDEVTEIELPLQAKLLRVLQERTFERVGSSQTQAADVRVLATTNRDLQAEVDAGHFRQDLYFRLAVLPLPVPPLRERVGDILELADHFLQQTALRLQREPCRLDNTARDLLTHYHWPGNVRELQNLVTRASVLQTGSLVRGDDLRPWLIDTAARIKPAIESAPVGVSLHDMERRLIEATLEHYRGHRAQTAQALGIGLRTLLNKLRSYGYGPRSKGPKREEAA